MWLDWTLDPSVQYTDAYLTSGSVISTSFISYPGPSLSTGSLRLNNTANVSLSGDHSVAILPPTGESFWLTFQGQHFGHYAEAVTVSYSDENGTSFACVTTPIISGDLHGSISDSRVICRTAQLEPSATYFFTVVVGGQTSAQGLDELIFPGLPSVVSVAGCVTERDGGTFDCNTAGGQTITIQGTNFWEGMVCTPPLGSCSDVM